MAVVTEHLRLLITASAKGVSSEIRAAATETEQASIKTRLYEGSLKRLGLEGVSTGKLIGTGVALGAAAGGVALAKFALDGVGQFASLTAEVRGFQRVSGVSAESASKLTFAVKQLGIAPDSASMAFGRLATRLGTGKANLDQFGISTKDASGKNRDMAAIVADLSDKYQQAGSAQERARIGNEAFGRSWQTLAPLLGKGREDLQAIYEQAGKDHQIFTQNDLEMGRQYTVATRELGSALQGLKVELGSALMPAVTQITTGFTTTVQTADSATQSIGGLAGIAKASATAFSGNFSPAMNYASAASSLFKGHFSDAATSMAKATPVLGQVVSLFDDGSDSSNKFGDAQQKVKDKTTALANAVADHGAKSSEAKKAQSELTSATRELSGMQKGLEKSLTDSSAALQTHTEKLYADQQAALASFSGTIAVGNAVEGVRSKLQGLIDARNADVENGDVSAEAVARQAQAQRDLASAVTQTMAAYAKKAVDDLGPNATAAEKQKAATDAQRQALEYLEGTFPGLREQLGTYLTDLDKAAGVRQGSVGLDTSQAHSDLDALEARLKGFVGMRIPIHIDIKEN